MYVWIVKLVDQDSSEIICVCSEEDKAKDEWQKQIDKQIKLIKEIIDDISFSYQDIINEYYLGINMYENLTLDNVSDANYSYYIPIIKPALFE